MAVSLDELCNILGFNEIISKKEYEKLTRQLPAFPLVAKWFDIEAMPITREIAPIISNRLNGAETALELGFGTGLRLLYYALNNPSTRFVGIDNDPFAVDEVKKRIKKTCASNVSVELGDVYTFRGAYSCIMGIECLNYPRHKHSITEYLGANCLYFGRMVDTAKPPSFFCTHYYNIPGNHWTQAHTDFIRSVMKETKLNNIETVPFSFKKDGDNRTGGIHFFKA
jgi:hypothetical protein